MDTSVTIIGGGVVGLAIAAELSSAYSPLFLLEQHEAPGRETSSRNSEVIHAGIYYPDGSLKARLCIEGKERLYKLCSQHEIGYRKITKIITAASAAELEDLGALYRHGLGNGVPLEELSARQVHDLEPHIASCGGILSPSTGIISAHDLMNYYAQSARNAGATIQTGCRAVGLERIQGGFQITVREPSGVSSFTSEVVVNAAGLHADTVAALAGIDTDDAGYTLHWAKGSYFAVQGEKRRLVSRLIYPMPPRESLGIHAVLDLAGRLRFGPDVEYLEERTQNYRVDDSKRSVFGKAVRQILPSVADDDLVPDISGIRAKLQAKGEPPKDFIIREESDRGLPGFINLIGIDSPGLTASPAIARYVRHLLR